MNKFLRWEDFLNSSIDSWQNRSLYELFSNRQEKNRPDLPLLAVTGSSGVIDRDDLERRDTSNADKSKYLRVAEGDIVYNTMRMWQGVSGSAHKDGIVSPAYTVAKPSSLLDKGFAKYFVKNELLVQKFHQNSQGLVNDTLNLKFPNFASINALIPPLPEQRKIASILTSVNEVIENTRKQIEKLQDLKKATMNELLTMGIGHTEFKDSELGRIPKSWEVKELGDISKIYFSNVDKKSYTNEIPVFLCNYMDVYSNSYIKNGIEFMRATAKQREIDKFLLLKGDVIITKDSETPDDIAVPAYVSEHLKNVLCGYHLALIRSDKKKLSGIYLAHLFELDSIRHRYYQLANGSTRFGLTSDAILESKILVPPLLEQQKITSILTSMDENIEEKQLKLRKTESLKKSLMQDLLTGRVRVKVN